MRVFLDTCVIVDYLSNREPYSKDSEQILALIANNKIYGYTSASCITDIHYILKKYFHDEKIVKKHLVNLISLVEVLDTLAYNIKTIFDSAIPDFEDALIEEISYQTKIEYIVTRNTKDFKSSRVKVVTPKKLITIFNNKKVSRS